MRDHDGQGAVRGFHGTNPLGGGITRSFQSDNEAKAELDRILTAVGLNWIGDRISLRVSNETQNASAGITLTGERFIFYNATFMQDLKQKTAEQWSLISILAHELGHHLAFHTVVEGRWHEFELEADYFSGFVLRRLGASLAQAHAAMRSISPKAATLTHPALDQRLQVITVGWTDGGGSGTPRGLKQDAAPAPSVPAAPTPPVATGQKTTSPPPASPPPASNQSAAAEAWQLVKDTTDIAALEAFIRRYGETFYGDLARTQLERVKTAQAERQRVALLDQQNKDAAEAETKRKADEQRALQEATRAGRVFRDCADVCPEMVVVPAGSYTMGSPASEKDRSDNEGPQRKVTIAKAFAVGKFEVTFAEWEACVAANACTKAEGKAKDEGWGRGKRPVINVSWDDITKEYLPWLSKKSGQTYRLLTEAEWEYAARAGTTTRYSFGDEFSNAKANNDKGKTVDVGQYAANAFGLHDMHGNVWEWVQDCWNADYKGAPNTEAARTTGECNQRVVRGGSFFSSPGSLRAAVRSGGFAGDRIRNFGFRLARTLF
jgi:formylglycine-generating enzyme required for sulfatase activity